MTPTRANARFRPPANLGSTEEVVAAITHPEEPGLARLTYDDQSWIIDPATVLLDPEDGWVYCEVVRES